MPERWHADSGAQAERTLLAWLRTALAAATMLVAVGRELMSHHPFVAGVVLACAPGAVVIAGLARRRYSAVRLPGHLGRPDGAVLLAATGGLVLAGGMAVLTYVLAG